MLLKRGSLCVNARLTAYKRAWQYSKLGAQCINLEVLGYLLPGAHCCRPSDRSLDWNHLRLCWRILYLGKHIRTDFQTGIHEVTIRARG